MVSFKKLNRDSPGLRLSRLQELQTEIYRQLQCLIPDAVALYDSFESRISGSPLLRMDILERHPYTLFLRLTYQFNDNQQQELAPDAHIRIYNDARLAEVTSYDPDQGFTRTASPWHPQHFIFQNSWRQNRALDKWLSYLIHQGHSLASMQPSDDKISGKPAIPIKETTNSY